MTNEEVLRRIGVTRIGAINNQKETDEISATYNEERRLEGFNNRRTHRRQETGRKTVGNLYLGK